MHVLPAARRALARFGASFSFSGLVVALLAFAASTTPSLVPRGVVFATAISAVCTVAGYGLGVGAAWVARTCGLRRPSATTRRRAWWVLATVAVVVVPLSVVLGARAQQDLARLWGLDATPTPHYAGVVAGTLLLALLLLAIGRGLRGAVRAVGRVLGRRLPPPVAIGVAVVVVAALTIGVVSGAIRQLLLAPIETSFVARDATTRAGVTQPDEPERSGSPASLEAWDTLGYEGRIFVAGGPGADGIAAYTGEPAQEPIRVYAGVAGSGAGRDASVEEQVADAASRVVSELDRTDAWSREILALVTTTGTGWVDPAAMTALELLHGGDTAVAAIQYSTNPSWVTLVAGRTVPELAGRALLDAVAERWDALPAGDRPRLVLFGESLGAYGSQGSFATLDDVRGRVDGAVWVGTPRFTPLWTALTEGRDPGSTEIHPVLDDGADVRWATANGGDQGLTAPTPEWGDPRVVYVQHPSDAVVWWDPDVAWRRPDWLAEPHGQDVLPGLVWIPGVTFVQLTGDMFAAGSPGIPTEYGHRYRQAYADAWAAVVPPPGWTDADTTRLREHLAEGD